MNTHQILRFVWRHSCASPGLRPKSGTLPCWLLACLLAFIVSQPLSAQSNYATPYTFTTLAGSGDNHGSGSTDGTGRAATFAFPLGVAVDAAGLVYVADTDNNKIRKITPTGVVTTLASLPALPSVSYSSRPTGVAVDGAGNVYVAEYFNNQILKITPAGVVTSLAGNPTRNPDLPLIPGFFGLMPDPRNAGSADGSASTARFDGPSGVAIDSSGNVYVADTNNRTIRKISPTGMVTTLAGQAGIQSGSVDGTGRAALFWQPQAVAIDGAGNLYVCDGPRIRKITPAGVVTSIPPLAFGMDIPGSTDGPTDLARFQYPAGVTVDGTGNVYVSDTNNHTIRKITVDGMVTTIAGLTGSSGSSDGTGSAARFYQPWGLAVDATGTLYLADTANHSIRKGMLAISKATQTITFADLGTHTYGEAPITLAATASSGLAVSYAVVSGPATLTGSTLTFTGIGTVTIRASQSGDASFEAAPGIERSFAVNPAASAPVFTTQPAAQTVSVGTAVTFSAAASGTPGPTYQWRKSGADISGATSNTYTMASATTGDAGAYTVVATNSAGSVTSAVATLTVNPLSIGRKDFNGDGKAEILWTNTATGDRAMWQMNGTTLNLNSFMGTVPVDWTISGTGDFDGDGKADLFWTNTATGDRAVWLMTGCTLRAGGYLGSIPVEWAVSNTGDCDGDGKADILWTNTVTGERAIWIMNGLTTSGGASLGVVPVAWVISGTGDFNGDGKTDLLLSNTVSGDRAMWFMHGTTISTNAFVGTVPATWAVSGTGDFNGDGKADIFWSNTVTGDRAVWLMNGSTLSTGGYLGSVPVEWMVSSTGDFNGDGKADLLWSNTATGERAIWLMNGSTTSGGASLGVVPTEWVTQN